MEGRGTGFGVRRAEEVQCSKFKVQGSKLRNCARIARLRFDEGFTSYIEVLDAERFLFAAELSYTQTHAALFRTLVNLYKALGGGWVDAADGMTAADPAGGDNATGP